MKSPPQKKIFTYLYKILTYKKTKVIKKQSLNTEKKMSTIKNHNVSSGSQAENSQEKENFT